MILDDDRYAYDEWEMDDDDREDRRLEQLLSECGWVDEDPADYPHCLSAGSEFCDFECPLRGSRRRAEVHWRARQRRRHGRGVGSDPRRPGFAPPWLVRWSCRRRRARRKESLNV